MDKETMQALAEAVAERAGIPRKSRRRLRVVGEDAMPGLSALQRDALYHRIRDLESNYGLGWLVRQETMAVYGVIECLTDAELQKLLETMHRAEEALLDGVPFVEVGLIRGVTCNWVA